jgi:hypothetical protein
MTKKRKAFSPLHANTLGSSPSQRSSSTSSSLPRLDKDDDFLSRPPKKPQPVRSSDTKTPRISNCTNPQGLVRTTTAVPAPSTASLGATSRTSRPSKARSKVPRQTKRTLKKPPPPRIQQSNQPADQSRADVPKREAQGPGVIIPSNPQTSKDDTQRQSRRSTSTLETILEEDSLSSNGSYGPHGISTIKAAIQACLPNPSLPTANPSRPIPIASSHHVMDPQHCQTKSPHFQKLNASSSARNRSDDDMQLSSDDETLSLSSPETSIPNVPDRAIPYQKGTSHALHSFARGSIDHTTSRLRDGRGLPNATFQSNVGKSVTNGSSNFDVATKNGEQHIMKALKAQVTDKAMQRFLDTPVDNPDVVKAMLANSDPSQGLMGLSLQVQAGDDESLAHSELTDQTDLDSFTNTRHDIHEGFESADGWMEPRTWTRLAARNALRDQTGKLCAVPGRALFSPSSEPINAACNSTPHESSVQSAKLWTAKEANDFNPAPIFVLRDGKRYRHPPLPPGWMIGVSQTKNRPYYYHTDFGTSFSCPVHLPDDDGQVYGDTPSPVPSACAKSCASLYSSTVGHDEASRGRASTISSNTVSLQASRKSKFALSPVSKRDGLTVVSCRLQSSPSFETPKKTNDAVETIELGVGVHNITKEHSHMTPAVHESEYVSGNPLTSSLRNSKGHEPHLEEHTEQLKLAQNLIRTSTNKMFSPLSLAMRKKSWPRGQGCVANARMPDNEFDASSSEDSRVRSEKVLCSTTHNPTSHLYSLSSPHGTHTIDRRDSLRTTENLSNYATSGAKFPETYLPKEGVDRFFVNRISEAPDKTVDMSSSVPSKSSFTLHSSRLSSPSNVEGDSRQGLAYERGKDSDEIPGVANDDFPDVEYDESPIGLPTIGDRDMTIGLRQKLDFTSTDQELEEILPIEMSASRRSSRLQPFVLTSTGSKDDEISALGVDDLSLQSRVEEFIQERGEIRSHRSLGGSASTFGTNFSHRVRHPPMPLCSLQNVGQLERYASPSHKLSRKSRDKRGRRKSKGDLRVISPRISVMVSN